jgi:hypothetical protein
LLLFVGVKLAPHITITWELEAEENCKSKW